MPRLPRVVPPGYAHHVTQRGVRRGDVFFSESDRALYLRLMKEQTEKFGVRVLCYCLMTNYVHLLAVPKSEAALSRAIGEAHRGAIPATLSASFGSARFHRPRRTNFWTRVGLKKPISKSTNGN